MSAVPEPAVHESLARLKRWAAEKAYPLWWSKGADQENGGFYEKLALDGSPLVLPKRARVQPRQIYSFSQAAKLGWQGDALAAVRHGVEFYIGNYRRPDGLFRTLVAPDGKALDESTAFYDQAFALFGLHSAYLALGKDPVYRDYARTLIAEWSRTHKHPVIGFEEAVPRVVPLCSNPHMHLFESCLAWLEEDPEGPWRDLATEIARLATTHFIDGKSGALREFFDGNWQPMPGQQGRIVEPGHQFEWSWLLMRWSQVSGDDAALKAGLRLVEIGETFGTDDRGVAFNGLLDDFTPHDKKARLWPQTERLKAHCLAAELTGDAKHWELAVAAASGLEKYFATPVPGLWRDIMNPDGSFIEEPAPASSFYHIICSIAEFDRAVAG
jgi:mannose-6-phosphate isomerase